MLVGYQQVLTELAGVADRDPIARYNNDPDSCLSALP